MTISGSTLGEVEAEISGDLGWVEWRISGHSSTSFLRPKANYAHGNGTWNRSWNLMRMPH